MAVSTNVDLLGIDSCSFTPAGGSPVPIMGIGDMTLDFQGKDVVVEGDGGVLSYLSKMTHMNATFNEAVLSLTALAALTGNTAANPLVVEDAICPVGMLTGIGQLANSPDAGIGGLTTPATVTFLIAAFRLTPGSLKINATMKNAASVDFAGVCVPAVTTRNILTLTYA